jgi:uncharacterized membrane protein YfcA
MLNSFPIAIIIGCALGFLAGLGVGGGSLLILWLTLILGLDHTTARGINLLFFIPTAVIASLFRWRQGSLRLTKILPAVIGGCIAASVFTVASKHLQPELLQKLFGQLLILTGIRELFYRPRKAK